MKSIEFNKKLHQARYLMQMNQHPDALKVYGELAKEFPQGFLMDEYARAAAVAGEFDLAERMWENMLATEPNTGELLSRIAGEYGKIWLFARARTLSYKAAELEPKNFEIQLNLASFLARTNSVEEARAAIDHCLKLDPGSEGARYLSAHLYRRENKLPEAEALFRDMLGTDLRDQQVKYFCLLELGRILDATERYDEAMIRMIAAKKLAAQTLNLPEATKVFDDRRERMVRKTRSLPKNILEIWGGSFPASARTSVPPLAFLGGHARSGTTLLERILDAHPSVAACDEALAFQTIGPLIDITAPEIPIEGLNFLRQRYLKNLTKVLDAPPAGKTLVDKNPPVTAYLPAFLRAFPELRVLIALRDPRDVLVSCYFQTLVQVSHLSFERLADHYRCIMDVWLAVREWDDLNWLETRYEDIVADISKEGARVTQFLGLEWDLAQASFHEQNREKPVLSSNYGDVTKPVYKRAVGRWLAYEKYLAPVLPVLEPYCKQFGYH